MFLYCDLSEVMMFRHVERESSSGIQSESLCPVTLQMSWPWTPWWCDFLIISHSDFARCCCSRCCCHTQSWDGVVLSTVPSARGDKRGSTSAPLHRCCSINIIHLRLSWGHCRSCRSVHLHKQELFMNMVDNMTWKSPLLLLVSGASCWIVHSPFL